jgi:two-component system CitB family response regulator
MIKVLVVDDDFRVARVHADLAARVEGVEVIGMAHTAAQALELAAEHRPDLVLLDEHLPDEPGSRLMRRLDAAVIMVTADGDPDAVRRAVAGGALAVVLKPFPPEALIGRLVAFVRFRRALDGAGSLDQAQVDHVLTVLHGGGATAPPAKGRSSVTAEAIRSALESSDDALTAADVAGTIGVSRATAQRYLSDLVQAGRVELSLRYGVTGRPEHRYAWRG